MLRNNYQSHYDYSQTRQMKQQLSLLEKKDQQIRRLQSQLEQEKRRADNAVKMLQNYKSIQIKYEEGNQTFRNQMSRRIKAEEEVKILQQRNFYLQQGIRKYISQLKEEAPKSPQPKRIQNDQQY